MDMNANDLIDLFTKEPTSSYNNFLKFQAILLFVIIFLFFSRFLNKTPTVIIMIILLIYFGFYVSNVYVKTVKNDLDDFNKKTMFKLNSLQTLVNDHIKKKILLTTKGASLSISNKDRILLLEKNKLDNLYIDANMIHFLYSIKKLYDYNPDQFYKLLKGTNQILKIRNEIEIFYDSEGEYTENIHEMFEIAIQLRTNCLNNLHNMIYTVPKISKMYKYVDDIIIRYGVLLDRNLYKLNDYHLDDIKNKGINNRTKFIYINHTKPYDRLSNHSIIPTNDINIKSELIDFYL
jgi:hypothetical protein